MDVFYKGVRVFSENATCLSLRIEQKLTVGQIKWISKSSKDPDTLSELLQTLPLILNLVFTEQDFV